MTNTTATAELDGSGDTKEQLSACQAAGLPRGSPSAYKPEIREVMPVSFVYFIIAKTTGAIKIGYASRPWARLSNMQTGSPDELLMLGLIETYLPLELERDLHQRFAEHRLRGEWFACCDAIVDYAIEFGREPWKTPEPKAVEVIPW